MKSEFIKEERLPAQRLYELDWLRVVALGVLIFYHIGMLYAYHWEFHYKSQYTSEFVNNIMLWSNRWRMSLLFLIGGAAVSFMLAKNHGWRFATNRIGYLLLPLLFGMLVVVVPQVYIEANSKQWMTVTNYWQFWYTYLNQNSIEFAHHKTVGSLHLTWNHLWFLPYLLVYSLFLWIVYPIFRLSIFFRFWKWVSKNISIFTVVLLPIILSCLTICLEDRYPVTHNFVEDWFNHARSFLFFVIGFLLVRTSFWNQIVIYRRWLLSIAIVNYLYIIYSFNGGSLGNSSIAEKINLVLWMADGWFWILALISWSQYFCKSTPPIIRYLNSGVFCFYVFHQTFIVLYAYLLTPFQLGRFIEPLALVILVIVSCLLSYELLRRIPFMRVLCGISTHKY
jgi:glucans biosynthesis protein C